MNTLGRNLSRRSFLKLPGLLPLTALNSVFHSGEHHFQYEGVVGTSMDLVVWTTDPAAAESARRMVLSEIHRLASILNARIPTSEISLMAASHSHNPSQELAEVLAAYDHWEQRTGGIFSIRPGGANTPRNVDALGKSYIIDRAAQYVRTSGLPIEALLLNVGGDIVTWGRSCEIAVADPDAWYDNAEPITRIHVRNAAIATSGMYARGPHLLDALTGSPVTTGTAATVIAPDAVTANALATTLCVVGARSGMKLVGSTPGAEALRIEPGGVRQRSAGLARFERPLTLRQATPTQWPPGYQLTITLPLTPGRSNKRPYVAVWVENSAGQLVRILAFWGSKSKYFGDLSTIWNLVGRNQNQIQSISRATRPSGKYELVWDGLDDKHNPVPQDTYRILVETNQEHGTYAKQAGTISLGDSPATITLPATTNFDTVTVQYGPKPVRP
jgi:thiamine biosynthesis lipoprotein